MYALPGHHRPLFNFGFPRAVLFVTDNCWAVGKLTVLLILADLWWCLCEGGGALFVVYLFFIGEICRICRIVDGLLWYAVAVLLTVVAAVIRSFIRTHGPCRLLRPMTLHFSCLLLLGQPLAECSHTNPLCYWIISLLVFHKVGQLLLFLARSLH